MNRSGKATKSTTTSLRTSVLKITEKSFQQQVVDYARLQGWFVYHTYNSRRSTPGFPDLTLVRAPRVIFAELKVGKGRLSMHQSVWRERLLACEGIEYYLWRPDSWDEIEEVLKLAR